MGQVYRATDTRLGRDVALKVLPPEMAASRERLERFQREARAVAALNHPHVVTIYSVEESEGIHFLTMELVEGESVDRLIPDGGMAVPRLLDIASGVASALAAAHDRGIVHRDLKPANAMVTKDGRLKVLDFGLAKMAESVERSGPLTDLPTDMQTREGVVMGTMPYMSPEQLQGEGVDHRTDIFSLGVMLYEMVCGERPFRGTSSANLISAILRDTPRPLVERRKDLPEGLIRIITRCLEKSAADRFPSAREVVSALAAVTHPVVEAVRSRTDEAFWIAVLPFKCVGGEADLGALAEGLSDEITTGLSRFRYLSVVSSTSANRLKEEAGSERDLGARLGARYALEGSIRKGGSAIRVSAQLVDVSTGARLWAETYNRDVQGSDIFTVQDDIAARIVSTLADSYGVLVHSIRSAMRQKDDADLTPLEWQFQFFAYREQLTPAAHAELTKRLERALERNDTQSDLSACLAQMHVDSHNYGLRKAADTLDRALAAARRAVEIDRTNQFALVALAQVHFFRRDLAAFGPTAERAIALNPLNTSAVGILGLLIVHTGEFQRGAAIVRRAMELNANHAGWLHFAPLWEHFQKGEYEHAVERANRVDVPGFFWTYLVLASASGHLGRHAEAEAAVRDLLAIDPEFAVHARATVQNWHFASGLLEAILDGLRKAGLSIPATSGPADSPERSGTVTASSDRTESGTDSGQVRADEGFWIAVLPFKNSGSNSDITALAGGLTEDIVTGLSRFSYLRVIARNSAAGYSSESSDVRATGKALGARYVMEGTLRQAGARLRLAVQLVDSNSGAHLWAETFERTFSPETLFELQDDLVPRIVSTVADTNGILARSMSEAVRGRDPEQLTPYEAVLRSFGYGQRITPEELAEARSALESAVRKAPAHSDAWAMLAWLHVQDYAQGFSLQADSLASGLTAAQRAVDAAPSNHLAWFGLAQALFFHKEFQSFRNAAERTVALNPMDGNSIAFLGELLNYAGDWERGLALAGRAKQLNPNYPGWYWYADFYDAYRRGDYRGALNFALKINLPGQFFSHAVTAAASGQLGEADAATKAVRELLKLSPDFVSVARKVIEKWWEPEYIERMIDGWRKAGLEIADAESSASHASRDTSAAQVSIAVLPFSDMSAAKDQEYLCEGMAEEIMNALVRIDGIRVASRTSAFRAGRSGDDLASISRALSVGHVLEGSVRTAGARLRATAQLTDVASGYQLWSEQFDREAIDVFAIQDEIAAGVVDAVKARLAPGTRTVHARPQIRNLDAYRSYLKGRHLRGVGFFAGAVEAFEESVRLDPTHAPSWTGLAEITILSAHMGMIPPRAACTAARKMLVTACELQGESAEGMHTEAFAAFLERRWEAMETAWWRAIELQPDHVLALASWALTLCSRGRLDEALPLFERAREADPLASFPYNLTSWGLLESGRPEEALRYAEDALSFDKDASAIAALCMAYVSLGRHEEAIAAGERGVVLSHRASYFVGILGWALARAGRDEEARTILEELRARPAGSPTAVSEVYLLGALGQIDDAFDILARAEVEHQGLVCYTGQPGFDSIRSDPRFVALQRRLGLSPA